MISIEFLRDLYRHMEWADSKVWSAIESIDLMEKDEYLHNTTHHLHATQRAFMSVWTNKPVERPDPTKFADLEAIRIWSEAFYGEADTFLASLTDSDLKKNMVVPWVRWAERLIKKEAQQTTLGETVYQVAVHSAYHRGQINRRIRELGIEPPLVDYIVWVWLGRPGAKAGTGKA